MSEFNYPLKDWMKNLFYGDSASELRFEIITDIISHPTELTTTVELYYVLTATEDWTKHEVQSQLDSLRDVGLITQYETEEYRFIGLTDAGKQFIVDSQHYRGHQVWKSITRRLERTDEITEAYNAERPHHEPSHKEYSEADTHDSEQWTSAHDATFRTLTLILTQTDETTFAARLIERDTDSKLAQTELTVENVDTDWTHAHREMNVSEKRGTIKQNHTYGIEVVNENGTYKIQPEKEDEGWYSFIERPLCIFTN